MGAKKNDQGKLRLDLLPIGPLLELGLVMTKGCRYGDQNWRSGMKWSRCIAAMLRHLYKWLFGIKRDPEGFHHLAAVMFYCAVLMEYEKTNKELDDRVENMLVWKDVLDNVFPGEVENEEKKDR